MARWAILGAFRGRWRTRRGDTRSEHARRALLRAAQDRGRGVFERKRSRDLAGARAPPRSKTMTAAAVGKTGCKSRIAANAPSSGRRRATSAPCGAPAGAALAAGPSATAGCSHSRSARLARVVRQGRMPVGVRPRKRARAKPTARPAKRATPCVPDGIVLENGRFRVESACVGGPR